MKLIVMSLTIIQAPAGEVGIFIVASNGEVKSF